MRTGIVIFIFIILSAACSFSMDSSNKKFFRKANKFFAKNISDGKVYYTNILKDREQLDELVAMISEMKIQSETSRVQEAFYINAYNILIIKNIIDNFPVPYPIEEMGFFSKTKHVVAGDTLTLNEIESAKLLNEFKDARLLFVLSSACKGSIPVADFAFKPKKLDKQFKKRIKATANDYRFVRVMDKSSKILFAEALMKSQTDFLLGNFLNFINKYREEPLPVGFTIEFYPEDRNLNIKN